MPWRPQDRQAKYGAGYRRKRLAAMQRAGWRCEIRIEGICIGAASECDHEYGIAADPDHHHLRAACAPCHAHVTARQGKSGSRQRDPDPLPGRTNWDGKPEEPWYERLQRQDREREAGR
jgi:hypothetical protein